MGTRLIAAVVAASSLSAGATAAVVQVTAPGVAGAAQPPPNQIGAEQPGLKPLATAAIKQLDVQEKILLQLKSLHKDLSAGMAKLDTDAKAQQLQLAGVWSQLGTATSHLSDIKAATDLLVFSSPNTPPAFNMLATYSGIMPKLLEVSARLCAYAQDTEFGRTSGGAVLGCQ